MDIDWKKVKKFTVIVGNRSHRAVLSEIGSKGELYLQVTERDHPFQKAATGGPGQVIFVYNNQSYYFHGKICAHGEGRILVLREAGIILNKRQEPRLSVPPFPVEIKEKALFRIKTVEAFVYDICRYGVKVATEVSLPLEKQYTLDAWLMLRKTRRFFSAVCTVRYCVLEKKLYFSGLRFDQVGIEEGKVLEKFLNEVRAEMPFV